MKRFSDIFLLSAIVLFFATGRSAAASVILIFAGVYMLIDVIPKIRRILKNADK